MGPADLYIFMGLRPLPPAPLMAKWVVAKWLNGLVDMWMKVGKPHKDSITKKYNSVRGGLPVTF